MVHHQTADDHLEGRVDRVDAAERSIAVLGVTASAVDLTRSDELLQALAPGTRVRVRGRCRERRFVASAVNIVPDSPIVTEEIQGPIESIAPLLGVLRVSGVTVIAGADTKIDRLDAR